MNSPNLTIFVALTLSWFSASCFLVARHRISGLYLPLPAFAAFVAVFPWFQQLGPLRGSGGDPTVDAVALSLITLGVLAAFWLLLGNDVRQKEK